MSSLWLTVAEILTFKVSLSGQNQQNLHFGPFWASVKFYFLFCIPPFLLKLLKFRYIFIFQNFRLVSWAVLELWWSKIWKNANFSAKKNFEKNFKNCLQCFGSSPFKLFWNHFSEKCFLSFLVECSVALHPALSIRLSVGRLVCQLDSHILHFFTFFYSLTSLLLPK